MEHLASPVVVALDIGTSSSRSVAYDCTGEMLPSSLASLPHDVRTTADGGAELDAEALLEESLTCLHRTEAALREAGIRPAAVCVSTFWHSLLGVDGASRAVTPVYMWADTRGAKQVGQLRALLDEAECHRRTGCVFHTSYLPAKLLWLRATSPETCRSVRWWMSLGEYLAVRLFGERGCSYSMASGTGIFNHRTSDWDAQLVEACGLTTRHLSPLVDERTAFAGPGTEIRSALGWLADVPWYPALGDGACSNVGSGGVTPERATLMIGTSGAIRVLCEPALEPPWGVWKYHVDRRRCLLGGALSNGGNLVHWLSQTLNTGDVLAREAELRALPPAGHGLTVLPFLAGERSPNWRPGATGAILGLRLHTQPLHLAQAALEAVAYRFALLAELMNRAAPGVREYVASGAVLLGSPYWMQMLADTLGKPVIESTIPEASSRGAALLAFEALGTLPSLTAVDFGFGSTYRPDPERGALYAAGRRRHQAAYQLLAAG
ncbi:MAG: hypothetical protein AUJ96_20110 [Armatimonadetes bacterium CG2_30_66_41]|nr:gluconokinase [Armatimonadota bacterium]NCO91467.1 gluconokinase [Armatimonadota bacterium]NCP30000.1 gluconokinase [Armatimonadota bacterium]NDK11223.1 gluconokinase [Armatimonadota bacterium]OIO99103.1 MAG: hypothetical protein AUJ96_20110 [Armatimonadetes bacterium CG2_30_66_41]